MQTIIFDILTTNEDKEIIKSFQKDWSTDFRKLYCNIDLCSDKVYLSSLKIKSVRLKSYLVKEVKGFYETIEENKKKIQENIEEYEKELTTYKQKHKEKVFKKLVKSRKELKSKVVFGGKSELKRRTKNLISNEEWKECRLRPIIFYGETSRNGNRFFDFKDISNGNILFKMETTKIKIQIKISKFKHPKNLEFIERMIKEKSLAVTVKLTHKEIHLSFNESIVNGTNFDYKLFLKEKPQNLNEIGTKKYWSEKHKEHEKYLKTNKLERYIAIDVNPNEIGVVILDEKMKIIDKGCYEIEGKISNDKRKYEYCQIIKTLFNKIKHYKVSYFIIEDLDSLNKNNYGNKVSNRKIKLEMKKKFIFNIIERRCNETGTILRKINPVYSSFIGNLTYKYYDPISSAMEICRRGINQFTIGFKLLPPFNLNNILTDKIDGFVDLNLFNSWIELFKSIRKKSYRRKDKTFHSYLSSKHSCVFLYI